MKKKLIRKLIYVLVFTTLVYAAQSQANHLFGVGIGISDYSFNFKKQPPFPSDKDINVNYTATWKFFSIEARQGFKYDYQFFNALKSSSYVLLGFSTIKEKIFSFNMLVGGVYTFMSNQDESSQPYYPSQAKPAVKMGFYFRLSKKPSIHLGFDALLSPYRYKYSANGSGGSGNLTLSALLSINYLLINKNDQ